jgi:hypothetical protein
MALNLFNGGYLPLEQRCQAETLYWAICTKLRKLVQTMDDVPEDLQTLDDTLADTYFCNFSLFQSIPDSWAIKQLFPVMPIHRLNEAPTREAVLGDITCDSDGKIDQFIDRRDVKRTLALHPFTGEPYYLGVFLVGAYQEILGDLHNLFGDTHAVHVSLDPCGNVVLESVIKGDTVREVLDYVEFDADTLLRKLRQSVEVAVRENRLNYEESGRLLRFYEDGLHGYTYLEDAEQLTSLRRRRASARRSSHGLLRSGIVRGDAVAIACGPAARPIVILISLDGWRYDYLARAEAPTLRAMAEQGVRSEGLIPSFPSKTFPNHYTIVTGLYPENHGIVSNTMIDPAIGPERFTMSSATAKDSRWWGGEPLWVTAEKQGQRSASMFWPGSEVEIGGVRPSHWKPYRMISPIGIV